ncbi:L domain-like protein [Ascobolus immersus RN42]|uniref:L domain-like protein n=1 Tax=Ascobolus immersus RN42 TaxID=1160509 RepID=A0A3N4IS20_ASCIM|nr:L domain-like protein [Ascobolus immersus RN42]
MEEQDDRDHDAAPSSPHYSESVEEPEPPKVSAAVKAERRTSKLPVMHRTTGIPIPKKPAETTASRTSTTASASRLAQLASKKTPTSKTAPGTTGIKPPTSRTSTSDNSRLARPTPTTTTNTTSRVSSLGAEIANNNRRPPPASLHPPQVSRKPSTSRLTQPKTPTTPTTPVARKPSSSQLKAQPNERRTTATGSLNKPPPGLKPRASNSQLTRKPSTLEKKPSTSQLHPPSTPTRRASLNAPKSPTPAATSPRSTNNSLRAPPKKRASVLPPKPVTKAASPEPEDDVPVTKKQSLRDTIAAARAAARKKSDATQKSTSPSVAQDGFGSFEFGVEDPFGQGKEDPHINLLKKRINSARTDGKLNIAMMDLKEIPDEVWQMYEANEDGGAWYEAIDLEKFIIADNEIECIGDGVLEVFGGVTSIDAHNNILKSIPRNWTDLVRLTHLNLTNNKLQISDLDTIFSIRTLVDLKLGKNGLTGSLPEEISRLIDLEVLELQENSLTSLPESLSELPRLKALDISYNQVKELPYALLSRTSLVELSLANNKFQDTLIIDGTTEIPRLHKLDIKGNRLRRLSDGPLALPSLTQFIGSANELESLPDMSEWLNIVTLLCDYNKVIAIPDGIENCHKLRTIDFTGNSITTIDPRLGGMESLSLAKFDGNPLRERNLVSMSTADLKRTLLARLEPEEVVEEEPEYQVKPGGMLDLSGKGLEQLPENLLDSLTSSPSNLDLAKNALITIPVELSSFASLTSLNISHNKLTGDDYFPEKVDLRSLTTLILSCNNITSIEPLLSNLTAPRLESLDISGNRITSLEGLRPSFPQLMSLLASSNQVEEIDVEAVDGLRVLDLSSNNIAKLPPLLGKCTTLKSLRVEGNVFRAPSWHVLEKGTEAVLAWLRDKLPPEEEPDVCELPNDDNF